MEIRVELGLRGEIGEGNKSHFQLVDFVCCWLRRICFVHLPM